MSRNPYESPRTGPESTTSGRPCWDLPASGVIAGGFFGSGLWSLAGLAAGAWEFCWPPAFSAERAAPIPFFTAAIVVGSLSGLLAGGLLGGCLGFLVGRWPSDLRGLWGGLASGLGLLVGLLLGLGGGGWPQEATWAAAAASWPHCTSFGTAGGLVGHFLGQALGRLAWDEDAGPTP